VAFRKKLTREKVLGFFAEQPRCIVAMEACGSAHHCSAPTPNDSFGDANGRRSDFEV